MSDSSQPAATPGNTTAPNADTHPIKTFTKLIEVALPLEKINEAAVREKSIRHGHPSTLHLWWARRPLAAARAVIFAQMVDDPSAHPDRFPTEEDQTKERDRLFAIIEELVKWESTTNEVVLERARAEIRRSWRDTCAANADHPRAAEIFNPDVLPGFHDPFAGGGALPLEAQRLGLVSHASDLNPVAVLINKAMIEIPPRFAGLPPVNPESRTATGDHLIHDTWHGAAGLAEDIRHYGRWMRDRAAERIGHLYPTVTITDELVASRPDLAAYRGRSLTVIAWLWARTVNSPDPAFRSVPVPLVSTFMLSTKKGKEVYVEPKVEGGTYRFTVQPHPPHDAAAAKAGTKLGRGANFRCLMSDTAIESDYIYTEANAGRMGARLMAIVCEGDRGRVYLDPLPEHEEIAKSAEPTWRPDVEMPNNPRWFSPPLYGLTTYGDLFTPRQLTAVTTFSDLVGEAIEQAAADARAAGLPDDETPLAESGTGARPYGEAVGVYLGFALSRITQYWSSLTSWHNGGEKLQPVFGRQAIPMIWDYTEGSVFSSSTGNFLGSVDWIEKVVRAFSASHYGHAHSHDAKELGYRSFPIVSTDPPYYDNIGYADLSDFFYVWLRRTLRPVYPELLATMTVPKMEELVATPYRHNGRDNAEKFFLAGMTQAMHQIAAQSNRTFPVTIYYAFKQSERNNDGIASTGWETFLEAVIRSGFTLTGTWPIRTEMRGRAIERSGTNALASSIVLVCRRRGPDAPVTTRARFIDELRRTLGFAIKNLQEANTPPVDMQQAAIGPGMAVYSRYREVREATGVMSVHDALVLINETLDEILGHAEGELDGHTRWAVTWFEQMGTAEGDYGTAESIANAKNVAVSAMVDAGVVVAKGGKVCLLRRDEMDPGWRPSADKTFTVWEAVQHLVRVLADSGEAGAAALYAELGADAREGVRDLCYRLYNTCERKGWAEEAIGYNRLIAALPSIAVKAQSGVRGGAPGELGLFD